MAFDEVALAYAFLDAGSAGAGRGRIQMNPTIDWWFGAEMFSDGFESGDLSLWAEAVP